MTIQTTKYLKVKPSDEYAWRSYGRYVREFYLTYPASKKKDNRNKKHRIKSAIFRRNARDKYVDACKERSRKLLSIKVPNFIHKLSSLNPEMMSGIKMGHTLRMKRCYKISRNSSGVEQ
jgi:hypothetical protein